MKDIKEAIEIVQRIKRYIGDNDEEYNALQTAIEALHLAERDINIKDVPKINEEYQCDHAKKGTMFTGCVWCNLSVGLKIAKNYRELKQRVENIKGLLEKKDHIKECNYWRRKHGHDCNCGIEDYNQAIDDYKPYITKMLNVERIEEILKTQLCTNYPDFVLKVCSKCKGCKKAIRLAKAIVKELGGK